MIVILEPGAPDVGVKLLIVGAGVATVSDTLALPPTVATVMLYVPAVTIALAGIASDTCVPEKPLKFAVKSNVPIVTPLLFSCVIVAVVHVYAVVRFVPAIVILADEPAAVVFGEILLIVGIGTLS